MSAVSTVSDRLLDALHARVAAGHVKGTPDGHGLTLYNYTQKCVYERAWDDITEQARGIVLDEAGQVWSRPFRKFFNLGERQETAPENLPAEVPELADKLDGSLIIVFWHPALRRFVASTRGGWDNPQCLAANRWLRETDPALSREHTYLFELVAPWNRIVVQYPDERLILIGCIHTVEGHDLSYEALRVLGEGIGLETVGFHTRPIADVDMEESVENAEGYVARFSNGMRVKLKFAEYRRLHKILTGLSIKGVWEMLSTGGALDIPDVPDEFIAWFDEQKARLVSEFGYIETKAERIFRERPFHSSDNRTDGNALPDNEARKRAAIYFQKFPDVAAVLFKMLDGKEYDSVIWKMVKPHGVSGTCAFRKDDEA